ncbi:multicopper oxidase domain-containing protein [Actinoplanes sp. NPDC049802]|uniref:multicopper oxidase domain-containing protein n=1 Tax=Actinoplanes sp. NPDC049802 TaxID=3154742 RepID=UPI0033C57E1F
MQVTAAITTLPTASVTTPLRAVEHTVLERCGAVPATGPRHRPRRRPRTSARSAGRRNGHVIVTPVQTVIVDFDATNPGQWMNHCDDVRHSETGMMINLACPA